MLFHYVWTNPMNCYSSKYQSISPTWPLENCALCLNSSTVNVMMSIFMCWRDTVNVTQYSCILVCFLTEEKWTKKYTNIISMKYYFNEYYCCFFLSFSSEMNKISVFLSLYCFYHRCAPCVSSSIQLWFACKKKKKERCLWCNRNELKDKYWCFKSLSHFLYLESRDLLSRRTWLLQFSFWS